jgi:outer membrane protein assembly factor BamA
VAVPPGTPSWEEVPLAERFFSGGASTNRAFPENQAGPRDLETGFPLGGNAYLFTSEELRFPLYGDNLGGVFFHDMGNVYSSIGAINLRFWQLNRQDFDYAVHSFGFGVRYRTPIGPIRVDLSLSPDSPRFVGFSGTRDQLLSGTGTPNVPQRINIFQFHFSLGQTF